MVTTNNQIGCTHDLCCLRRLEQGIIFNKGKYPNPCCKAFLIHVYISFMQITLCSYLLLLQQFKTKNQCKRCPIPRPSKEYQAGWTHTTTHTKQNLNSKTRMLTMKNIQNLKKKTQTSLFLQVMSMLRKSSTWTFWMNTLDQLACCNCEFLIFDLTSNEFLMLFILFVK